MPVVHLAATWQFEEQILTLVQLIMIGIFIGIAYFLLVVFADFGSHSSALQFGGFAVIIGAIVVGVRKMFPG